MVSVRAIYNEGQLRLLEPIDLREGQEVQVQIIEQPVQITDVIADLLVPWEDTAPTASAYDEDAVQRELDAALAGLRPLFEIIVEERHE